ncbi:hypothetical protein D9M72_341710 [compost metagenome]
MLPGRTGTPQAAAISRARFLSPMFSIDSTEGPIQRMPAASAAWAKAVFSERKP